MACSCKPGDMDSRYSLKMMSLGSVDLACLQAALGNLSEAHYYGAVGGLTIDRRTVTAGPMLVLKN